jgi:hypothetical protein
MDPPAMDRISSPERTEAADYYFKYIDLVPRGDICETLQIQLGDTLGMLRRITEERSNYRYAPGKWSIREVVSHINDTERLFVFRAFWFARGFDAELPSFDQEIAATHAGANARPWLSHIEEFQAIRGATLDFFRYLPEEAWSRRGIASGNPFTVRALAYVTGGHVIHHTKILHERYL